MAGKIWADDDHKRLLRIEKNNIMKRANHARLEKNKLHDLHGMKCVKHKKSNCQAGMF
jgi:hypothetical protein